MSLHSFRNFIALILSALLLAGMVLPGVAGATVKMDGAASKTAHQLQSQVKDQFADQLATKLQLPRISELNRSGATAQNFVPPADSSDRITVIVELQQEPVEVAKAQDANTSSLFADDVDSDIRQEHHQFRSALKPLQASIRYEFSHVFNGFSVRIPANKVDDLATIPGVKAVYPNIEIEADSNEPSANIDSDWYKSAYHIGANHLWDRGNEGSGIKVGVLDTGVDYHHPSLKGAFKGGYDFVDNDDDPMETQPDKTKPEIDGREYHTTHGTHVAGIIVGRGNNDHPGDSGKVRGIAPQADLYAYRVIGPYGEGNVERNLRAIEHAVYQDQVDVLNLSLGFNYNFQYSAYSVAVDNATKAGIVVVVAAGNAGPKPYTLGTPAGAHAAISVASSQTDPLPSKVPVFHFEGVDQEFFSHHATPSPILAVNQPLEAVYAEFGTPDDYKNKDVKGKLVVVSNGKNSLGDKSRTAKHAGAAALIIFNNRAVAPELGDGNVDEFVPTYTASQFIGFTLRQYLTSNKKKTVVRTDVKEQEFLASSSSRGPALPDYTIKPDIAAPGVAITSSVPAWDGNYEHAYERYNGTSMAAPHIAGAAALLVEYSRKNNLDLTPDEIKALMMNNAVELKDRTKKRYKLTEQGAGRVDLKRSVEAPAIALVQETASVPLKDNPGAPFEYETGSLSFGAMSPDNTYKKTIRLKSISPTRQPYSVSIDWDTDGGIVTSSAATVSPGETFDVTLQIPAHVTGNYEGHVILKGGDGHEIRLPVSVYVGKPAIGKLEVSPAIFAPNGHPDHNKTKLSIEVNKKINDFKLTVLNLKGEKLGDAYANTRENPGILSIDWDGSLAGNPSMPLADGSYYLVPVINGDRWDHLGRRFQIKITPPAVEIKKPEIQVDHPQERKGKITGAVNDSFLDNRNISIQDFIKMKAVNKATKEEYKVNMNADGNFTIDIPYLKDGRNEIDIYAWDSLKNGYEIPSRTISFDFDPDAVYANVRTESKQAYTGEEVKVDVGFSVIEAVYSGTYALLYDTSMVDVLRVEPSVTFVTYTQQQHPDVKLDFTYEIIEPDGLPDGWKAIEATTSMPPSAAYSGDGLLGTVVFSGKNTGIHEFKLGGLELGSKEPVKFVFGSGWIEFVNAPEPPEPEPKPIPEPKPKPSSGGSSSSRSYFTPSQPAGKSLTSGTYTVTGKDGKKEGLLLVSSAAIRSQLNDKEAAEVKLDIADIAWNDIHLADIRLARTLAEQLTASGKAPLLSGTDFEVFIPAESLVDFIGKNGDLTVRLALAPLPEDGQASPRRQVAPELTVQGEKETVTKPIRVGLKWSSSAVKDGRKVGVYAKDAKEAWTYYAPGVRWDKDGIRFTTASLGSYTAQEFSRTFDDIRVHWSKDKIEVLAAHQFIEGKGRQNTFKPNDRVTQAEFASQLDRLTGSGKTWKDRIAEPGAREPLTREKMVVMLVQALQLKIGADARAAVAVAVNRGYMKGMGGNTFSPEGTSTRAQAATVLVRVLLDLQSES